MTTQRLWDVTKWHPANNGAGKRIWFVCKGNRPDLYHKNARGDLIRYASQAGAWRIADKLNRMEASS